MTSKIKVDNIENQCGGAVVTKCGGTTTITGSVVKANNIQASDAGNIISQSGTTITLGASGDTVTLAAGASQSGFGQTYSAVSWDTTPKTGTFTAVSGVGYFVDTSSGVSTANLPAGVAGAIVAFSDYTRTFGTNKLTISPNGSEKIGGIASDTELNINGQAATFVYVDGTEGWINIQETQSSRTGLTGFVMASGGTETISGNCKIHTFTGPGTFCVSALANTPACNEISYLVVAGGGGGGHDVGGGGGAGGFREDKSPITPYTASPLDGAGPISVVVQGYPVTVGAGGVGSVRPAGACSQPGGNSIFGPITSTGGGYGGNLCQPTRCGGAGGSGGGGSGYTATTCGGNGNTPPVSPSQGRGGGANTVSNPGSTGGGGGGALTPGSNSNQCGPSPGFTPRAGGATTSISASPVEYSQGGRGTADGGPNPAAGGDNTGTGADGAGTGPLGNNGPNGGSGIVIIRYKFQ